MFKRLLHFFKYNNAAVFIVLGFFLLAGGVFAQSETGQDLIGEKQSRVEGEDNTLLLAVDLAAFDMDFKIGKIEKDTSHYYVSYTCLDIVKTEGAWNYEMSEREIKVPLSIEKDLGEYLAEEFSEIYESRLAALKEKQTAELLKGEQKKELVTEYDGLIGQTLSLADRLFPDYKAVKKEELPSPSLPALSVLPDTTAEPARADNLTEIYNDYISEFDPDNDNVFGAIDNCPADANPDQADSDADGQGDACDLDLPQDPSPDNLETPLDPVAEPEAGAEAPLSAEASPLADGSAIALPTEDGIEISEEEKEVEIIELNPEDIY